MRAASNAILVAAGRKLATGAECEQGSPRTRLLRSGEIVTSPAGVPASVRVRRLR
jgi:hypothetical protein